MIFVEGELLIDKVLKIKSGGYVRTLVSTPRPSLMERKTGDVKLVINCNELGWKYFLRLG